MLHQRFLQLQRRCRNFLKATTMSLPGDRIQVSQTNGESLMAMPNGRSGDSLRWLVERSKNFGALQAALDWIQEKRTSVERAPFGDNRKCKKLVLTAHCSFSIQYANIINSQIIILGSI